MRIEKDKCRVNIICTDSSRIKGFVHINPGERIIDFMNDTREDFIVLTSAEINSVTEVRTLRVYREAARKSELVILNKSSIKWIEEA